MTAPLISIVLSTKDRCELLGAAIEALLAQEADGLSYEVLIVDNNSSDATASLVHGFEQRSGGIVRYVFEGREGVSCGRNAGIAASRGSIVAFTDDDVRVTPAWLSAAAGLLLANPRTQYVGGPVLPAWDVPPPAWLTCDHWSPIAAVDYGRAPFEVPADRAVCLISANLFVRRTALDRVGWFDPAFRRCQDRDLMLRLWAAGMTGLYAPEIEATTIVPAERLTRGYHRRWHQTHGRFVALMPFRERRIDGGWAVEASTQGRFFLGAPLFEYRALLKHFAMWARLLAAHRMDAAFEYELRVRYSLSFILSWMRLRGRVRTAVSPRPIRMT